MIVFTRKNALKSSNRVLERDVNTRRTREDLCHMERLRQESFDLSRARNVSLSSSESSSIPKNRNDVFQLFVALQYRLHTTSHIVMLLTDDQRIKLA